MAVIIKGMEMPKNSPVLIFVWPDGRVRPYGVYESKKWEGVNAVPIPAGYGRLIDADALINKFERSAKAGQLKPWSIVENAPTIIPAEGEIDL